MWFTRQSECGHGTWWYKYCRLIRKRCECKIWQTSKESLLILWNIANVIFTNLLPKKKGIGSLVKLFLNIRISICKTYSLLMALVNKFWEKNNYVISPSYLKSIKFYKLFSSYHGIKHFPKLREDSSRSS